QQNDGQGHLRPGKYRKKKLSISGVCLEYVTNQMVTLVQFVRPGASVSCAILYLVTCLNLCFTRTRSRQELIVLNVTTSHSHLTVVHAPSCPKKPPSVTKRSSRKLKLHNNLHANACLA